MASCSFGLLQSQTEDVLQVGLWGCRVLGFKPSADFEEAMADGGKEVIEDSRTVRELQLGFTWTHLDGFRKPRLEEPT